MNEIIMNNSDLPLICGADFLFASLPFTHADRIMPFNVLIYVTSGQITVTEDEIDYEINPEEVFLLKSGIRHYGKKTIKTGTAWYYIHFYNDNLQVGEDVLECPKEDMNHLYMTLPKKVAITKGDDLEKKLLHVISLYNATDNVEKWYSNLELFSALSKLAFHNKQFVKTKNTLAQQICEFLQENIRTPFKAELLEREFFLSYKRLAAIFKQEMGLTMQQYHTQQRMDYACKLLRSSSLMVKEIANELGFTDVLYFSRYFHQTIGVSPQTYRKESINNY